MTGRGGALLVFLLAVAGAWSGASEWDDYSAAEDALAAGDCRRAAELLGRATSVDGRESARKNTYGMHFEPYYPYLLLARAHLCAGDGDLAIAALHESEEQGVASVAETVELRGRIHEFDGGVGELVWQARRALAAGDLLWAQGLVERALAHEPEHARGRELAEEISRKLRVDKLLVEARALERAGDATGALAHARDALAIDAEVTEAARIARDARAELDRAPKRAAAPRPAATLETTSAPASTSVATAASSADLLREARAYVHIGDVQGAVAVATRALASSASSEEVERLLGEIAREMARRSGASSAEPSGAALRRQFFREAVRAFHGGRYDDALARLSIAEQELQGSVAFHFYRGAALLSKWLLGGRRDRMLQDRARGEFMRAWDIGSEFEPDPDAFSPLIIDEFRIVRSSGEAGSSSGSSP